MHNMEAETITVPLDIAEELIYTAPGNTLEDYELVQTEFIDSGRWEEHWNMVIKYGWNFYAADYALPATEMQESGESPFGYDVEDGVVFTRVYPHEVVKIVYTKENL